MLLLNQYLKLIIETGGRPGGPGRGKRARGSAPLAVLGFPGPPGLSSGSSRGFLELPQVLKTSPKDPLITVQFTAFNIESLRCYGPLGYSTEVFHRAVGPA